MLAFRVRDIDATLAAARKLGLRVLTSGGVPVAGEDSGGPRKTVMIRDWDGFVVEFVQGGAPVSGVTMYVSVQDLAQTVAFYNRVFGFGMPMPGEARPTPDRIHAYFGDKSLATMRSARGTFPGSEITLNFQEFGAPDRKPARSIVVLTGAGISAESGIPTFRDAMTGLWSRYRPEDELRYIETRISALPGKRTG